MKMNRGTLIVLLAFITLNVYLFATAPAPLPERQLQLAGRQLPVSAAFTLLAQENDAARSLYTRHIVGEGQKAGLKFDEHWREKSVEAGPLPALFLRATAAYLEKDPLPLSLFLGSDFPISQANAFSGIQEQYFEEMKQDRQPRFFFDEATERYTAMFPDVASVQACVSCHNQHPDSPKTDWQLGDLMGATTWSFPNDSVSVEEMTNMLAAYRQGARAAYRSYLDEVAAFSVQEKPVVGNQWPADGYYLPTTDVFMESVSAQVSGKTFDQLLTYLQEHDKR